MELYIGNIPDDIDDYDLRKFFQVVGEQASFRIVTHDGGHNKAHRYGLASFDSDKLAQQVVKRFNGMPFKDQRVVVKEFSHRNYSNDRRALNWREADWDKSERRSHDRRGLMIQGRRTSDEGVAVFNLG
jgi:RNA recognition motif-containing protein